jgi:hypothetical protein
MGYRNRNMSIDDDVWLSAKTIVKEETGMTMSKFIEIYLRGIVRAKKGGLRDIVVGGVNDLIEMDNSLNARDKLKGFELVNEARKKLVKKKT